MKWNSSLKAPAWIAAIAVASCLAPNVWAGSVDATPPVVIKTVPVAGTKDVDPAAKEVLVTFSKPMQDGSWSWARWAEGEFPEGAGNPRYQADKRTCVLPVKLEPGKFYAIWVNTDRVKNFKDGSGRPAIPYLLTFQTKTTSKP